MAISGSCALLIGFAFGQSWWVMAPLALTWGFFVIADSAQFSVLVTESVEPHAVGTALTLQVSMGFLVPALAGYIAYAIADRPGIAPGFVAGAVAGFMGAGFLGAIVGGLLAGRVHQRGHDHVDLAGEDRRRRPAGAHQNTGDLVGRADR